MKNKNKSFSSGLFTIGTALLTLFFSILSALPVSAATDREIMENTGFVDEELFSRVLKKVLPRYGGYYVNPNLEDHLSFIEDYSAGTATEIPTTVLENLSQFWETPYMNDTPTITDFQGFEKLKGLTQIVFQRFNITDISSFESALSSLPELEFLQLVDTKFDTNKLDISGMKNLRIIILTGSSITDLDISQNNKKLKWITMSDNSVTLRGLTPELVCDESESECYYSLDLSEYEYFNSDSSTTTFTPADDSFTYDSDSKTITVPAENLASSSMLLTLVRTEQVATWINPEGVQINNVNIVFDLGSPDSPENPETPEDEVPEATIIPKAPNTGFPTM